MWMNASIAFDGWCDEGINFFNTHILKPYHASKGPLVKVNNTIVCKCVFTLDVKSVLNKNLGDILGGIQC
jgi:hypothetical protein